jgi:hypothetical protein
MLIRKMTDEELNRYSDVPEFNTIIEFSDHDQIMITYNEGLTLYHCLKKFYPKNERQHTTIVED